MANGEQGVEVAIGPPAEPDYLRAAYANTVNVNFTPHDFLLAFSLLEIPLTPPPGGAAPAMIQPTAVAKVVVPATVMHALIGLLRDQFDRYIAQYGAPGMNPEGPRSGDA